MVSFTIMVALLCSVASSLAAVVAERNGSSSDGGHLNVFGKRGEFLPWYHSNPTWNQVDEEALGWAIQCLAAWCESENTDDQDAADTKSKIGTGPAVNAVVPRKENILGHKAMVRCISEDVGRSEQTIAYICNLWDPARCTQPHLTRVFDHLRETTGSATGWYYDATGPYHRTWYGIDRYCVGNTAGCYQKYDPVAINCIQNHDYFSEGQGLQYDGLAGPAQQNLPHFKGTVWEGDAVPVPEEPERHVTYPIVKSDTE